MCVATYIYYDTTESDNEYSVFVRDLFKDRLFLVVEQNVL